MPYYLQKKTKNVTGVFLKAMIDWKLSLHLTCATVNRILLYFFRLCIFTLKDILKTQYKMI